MSGFFNFLKNLFSGILGILGLGSKQADAKAESQPKQIKRASGYFLELDDAKSVSSTSAKPAEKPATPAQTAQLAAAVAQSTPAKTEMQSAKVKSAATAEAPKPAPAAIAQALNLPKPTVTFASTYLAPGNGSAGRRRPGANMTSFLDMAKQVKTQG